MHGALAFAMAAIAAGLTAQSPLTTLFASNNSGDVGGTVLFNLTVHATVNITQVDCNTTTTAGTAGTLDIRTCPASYLGNEQNAAAWTTVSAGNPLVTAPSNTPTSCLLATPVTLAPGSYGVMLKATGFQHAYTNATQPSPNNLFASAELTLGAGAAQNAEYSPPFTPRVANATIHYVVGTSFAFRQPFGAGCYAFGHAFYERFPAHTFDLAGTAGSANTCMLVPNGIGGYVLVAGASRFFTPLAPPLPLGNDAVSGPLPLPFTLMFPGGVTNELRIGSNGVVFPTANWIIDASPSVAELLAGPNRFCLAWKDLDPAAGGAVHFDVDPGNQAVYCTWLDVPDAGAPAGTSSNTMQMAIFDSGLIELRYQVMDPAREAIVGHGQGGGVPDPGPIDISAVLASGHNTGPGAVPLALAASARPILGTTFQLVTTNALLAPVGASIVSLARLDPALELGAQGMPGCWQYIAPDSVRFFFPAAGTANVPITLPGSPVFAGLDLFSQSAVFVAGFNNLGVLTSNGLRLHVDTN
jgi:hypothetical protein